MPRSKGAVISARQRTRRYQRSSLPSVVPTAPEIQDELQAISTGALHMTVYDLLAHAYNRVAIQYSHDSHDARDEGMALLMDLRRDPSALLASALPPTLQREVVNALLADTARALATFFGFQEMNFVMLDHMHSLYQLQVREGLFFPNFQPGVYTQPFGTGLLGKCHLGRRTILVNDVSQAAQYIRNDNSVRAELCVPVILGDEVLAIIDTGANTVNAFTSAHATFIEGFARYLAPAITDPLAFLQARRPEMIHGTNSLAPMAQAFNFLYTWHEEWRVRFAELYFEAAQRNTELLALTDLSATLSASLQLDTILTTTVAKVAELLSCQVSWILLPDEDDRLRVRALHGGSIVGLVGAGIASDRSPLSTVFTRGEALITNDLSTVPRSSFDWAFCQRNGIVRYATVPLRAHERSIGVMNVGRGYGTADLTEHDVRLLATFASQIALAIENATLYEQSRLLGAAEERARLARDLHDTLAHSMLSIVRKLEEIEASPHEAPETLHERLRQVRTLARESLDEARRSVLNLPPATLEYATLREALEREVISWSTETGVRARFEQKGHPIPLAPNIQRELLLMTRESLHNVARHANATSVSVVLQFGAAGLRLLISDDGVGFDVQTTERHAITTPSSETSRHSEHNARSMRHTDGGMGLRGMRERARLLNGWLQIESAPGWGTRIAVTLPRHALELIKREYIACHVPPVAMDAATSEVKQTRDDLFIGSGGSGSFDEPTQVTDRISAPEAETPSAQKAITVFLADDHPATREGLRQALSATPTLRVVGVASTARETILLVRERSPEVLLLDMQLPDQDGLVALRELRAQAIATQIIIFTAFGDDANVAAALREGAVGYLSKDMPIPQLVEAIQAAAAGHSVFSPNIAARLQGRMGLLVNPHVGRLTPREHETLEMLAQGMRYRAIAQRLCVSEATVKFHAMNLYQKLQSSSRVEAINQARKWGLLR